MLISGIKRIIKEQLPASVQPWIDQILLPVNNAVSQFTTALTSNLTIKDNMLGDIYNFTLKTSQFPYTFTHKLASAPIIVFLGQIQDNSASPAIFTVAPVIQWSLSSTGTSIVIQTITGLDPTKSYNVTIVALGGG